MPDPTDYFSSENDPYIDLATGILRNIHNLKTQNELDRFEEILFLSNFEEASHFVSTQKQIDFESWKSIHSICFSDIYPWAGKARTIRMAKGSTVFAYPEHIETQAQALFSKIQLSLDSKDLTRDNLAVYFAEANVLHPFRDGNGQRND